MPYILNMLGSQYQKLLNNRLCTKLTKMLITKAFMVAASAGIVGSHAPS